MPLPEEYTRLFNTISDAVDVLDKLSYELRMAQMVAEELYISREDEDDEEM